MFAGKLVGKIILLLFYARPVTIKGKADDVWEAIGLIYFVGAGCGAPDLITVRGQRLLEQADIVIYAGSLVNPALLEACKPQCQIYNSAKMTLEEVLQVMIAAADKLVVRLHTGDPSLYGAIQEQMDALDKVGLPYEVCPGVSSMSGAAAALKREYTLPGVSQSVIVCRMEGRTAVPEREQLEALAAHQATMGIFLSAGLAQQVQEALLAGGYAADTPAAIVYKASWPDEAIYRCTVGTLAATAQAHAVSKTALLLVGAFLDSHYELSRLYAADFATAYRPAKEQKKQNGGDSYDKN